MLHPPWKIKKPQLCGRGFFVVLLLERGAGGDGGLIGFRDEQGLTLLGGLDGKLKGAGCGNRAPGGSGGLGGQVRGSRGSAVDGVGASEGHRAGRSACIFGECTGGDVTVAVRNEGADAGEDVSRVRRGEVDGVGSGDTGVGVGCGLDGRRIEDGSCAV